MSVYFHIGVHKTASSFMQRRFFPTLPSIEYCDCRNQYLPFLDYILHEDDFDYIPGKAIELFGRCGNPDPLKPIVISDEMLYAPIIWSRYVHRRRGCERLAGLFEDGKIAIVLRNQRSLVESFYRMYIKLGGAAGWKQFLKKNMARGYLHYDTYIEHLINSFGKSNVSVFLYEDFVENSISYLNSWCRWLNISGDDWNREITNRRENPSIAPHFLPILRIINRGVSSRRNPELILPKPLHSLISKILLGLSSKYSKSAYQLCPDILEILELLDECRDGNRKLSLLLDRDLSQFNYPC
jgi:hypothetical protein